MLPSLSFIIILFTPTPFIYKELPIFDRGQVLSDLLVHLAKLIPEEQGQDGVRAKPEIRGSQAFVESHHALLPQRLREAVDESFIKLPLKFKFKTDQEKIY